MGGDKLELVVDFKDSKLVDAESHADCKGDNKRIYGNTRKWLPGTCIDENREIKIKEYEGCRGDLADGKLNCKKGYSGN